MENTQQDISKERADFISSLGLDYKALFVPFSKSRNAGDKDNSLNWLIALSSGRRSLSIHSTQGIGHLSGYKMSFNHRMSVDDNNTITRSVETGVVFSLAAACAVAQPAPELEEVLYSLVMDSSVLDAGTFEEWADDYGYDTDSRKAEATYRGCLENALTLRAMIGDEALQKLRELFQDY
jgi:hypothetical protein